MVYRNLSYKSHIDWKIEELQSLGVRNLIEIDADWILNQTKIPTQLIYETLIDDWGNILPQRHIIPANKQTRIYLTVSFDDKDEVKELGAKFDDKLKKWYISKRLSPLFKKWIDVNRIYLCVPYEFVDEVKALGGKFDSQLNKWYITSYNEDLADFIYTPTFYNNN